MRIELTRDGVRPPSVLKSNPEHIFTNEINNVGTFKNSDFKVNCHKFVTRVRDVTTPFNSVQNFIKSQKLNCHKLSQN